jgi:diaminohydroxyphosphoribosylaminopyrimidine deaminase/5-amino-6-(5-phosphoribosylamino)uracil reductase
MLVTSSFIFYSFRGTNLRIIFELGMTTDEIFMKRCLQLAQNGRQNAAPNPMVGAVVVHDGRIIGEGYHIRCGEGHAEVNAIGSVKDPSLLPESTIYVSLEPCAHYGKTPPCAQLIIDRHIPRVVVGCVDPFAKVHGKGISMLREAGISVTVGVLEEECKALNHTFMTFHSRQRPFITLKWAQTEDGFIDSIRSAEERPLQISNPLSQMAAHKLRVEHQAILVGTNTARMDNPSLTVRAWSGRQPIRIVLDRKNVLPDTLQLFDGSARTIVVVDESVAKECSREHIALDFSAKDALHQLMHKLYELGIQSVLVEGGAALQNSLIQAGLWDGIRIETGCLRIGEGVPAPCLPKDVPLKRIESECFGNRIQWISHETSTE